MPSSGTSRIQVMTEKVLIVSTTIFSVLVAMPISLQAESRATVKQQSIRSENPQKGKEWLILPYAFSTDNLGTVFGVGGTIKGYGQD
jgi:hypothetical protein